MKILFRITMLLEFMFQGYCQYTYFSSFFKSKRNTNITIWLFLCASSAEYFLYMLFYNYVINLIFVVLFSMVICILCYESHISVFLLHSCITTCMLALCELVTVPFINLVMNDNYLESHAEISELLISTLSKLVMFTICWLVKQVAEKEIQQTKSVLLFIVPLLSIVLIYGIYYLSGANINIDKYHIVLFISFIVLMVINVVVFKVHENNVRSANENAKLKLSEQKQILDYENYKLLQENYENSRILIHDIKHHLNVINSMAENEDLKQYLKSLQLQEYLNNPQKLTGNKIIDVIIHQKSEICRNKGINFTFSPNNIKFEFADETDICCILSNLLDNAIESAEKSSEKLLNIEFFSHADRNMFFIEIENSCDNEPNMKNGHLLTAKKDKSKHGIGLYSVEKTVKKYNGELYFNYSEDTKKFRISVMLHK